MMLIESDLFIPVIKADDRHREVSNNILDRIASGEFTDVYASTAAIQEVVLWLYNRKHHLESIRAVNALSQLPNIEWLPIYPDICLKATILIKEYSLSPFDAYHAATALSRDSTILSTDDAYTRIPKLKHINPYNI